MSRSNGGRDSPNIENKMRTSPCQRTDWWRKAKSRIIFNTEDIVLGTLFFRYVTVEHSACIGGRDFSRWSFVVQRRLKVLERKLHRTALRRRRGKKKKKKKKKVVFGCILELWSDFSTFSTNHYIYHTTTLICDDSLIYCF